MKSNTEDPYKILGVRRDATPEEIKQAYRKRSKETHPDVTGGSHEASAQVNRAYEILSDDEARARYDATGTEKKPPTLEEKVKTELVATCLAILMESSEIETLDLFGKLRTQIKEGMDLRRKAVVEMKKKGINCHKASKRLKGKSKELLHEAFLNQAKLCEDQSEKVMAEIEFGEHMIKELEGMEYRFDKQTGMIAVDLNDLFRSSGLKWSFE